MSNAELRARYNENLEVIKKLQSMLEKNNENNAFLVKESIKKVEKEQDEISKKIRKNMYRNVSRKNVSSLLQKKDIAKEINENDEIILNEENVVIKNIEEMKDEPIKVINITGEEEKKIDDITEVLKKESIPASKLRDAKIVFDGNYKIVYDEGNGTYEQKVNDVLLDHNVEEEASVYNFNIIKMLKDFDEENNTKLYNRYMTNNMDVEYNFDKLGKKYDKAQIKKVKTIAKRESSAFKNVSYKDNRMRKFRKGLFYIATAGLMLFGGMGLKQCSLNTQDGDKIATSVTTESTTEITTETITEDIVSVKEDTKDTESSIKDDEKPIDREKEASEDEVVENEEGLKIGDTYNLSDTDLYYASTDASPRGNTNHIRGNYSYKASIISVVYKNQVMELVYNDSIDLNELEKVCKDKYGDDVKISINFDLVNEDGNVVTKHVGWVNNSDVLSKGKVLTR